jgi:hypothetical protein
MTRSETARSNRLIKLKNVYLRAKSYACNVAASKKGRGRRRVRLALSFAP